MVFKTTSYFLYLSIVLIPSVTYSMNLRGISAMDTDMDKPKGISEVVKISDARSRQLLRDELINLGPEEIRDEAYCDYLMKFKNDKRNLTVKQFKNGKLQIQGSTGRIYDEILEVVGRILGRSTSSNDKSYNNKVKERLEDCDALKISGAQIGSDESGKGDYFGPLVVAAVWANEERISEFEAMGVRDCKTLSDSKCSQIAQLIRDVDEDSFVELVLMPERYNEIYAQFKAKGCSLNQMLGYLHARAILRLAEKRQPQTIVVDKFGKDYDVTRNLDGLSRDIKVIQVPRGERNFAVAAASILARDRFVSSMKLMSEDMSFSFPLGASKGVVAAAKEIVSERGRDCLKYCAKLHFKTTDEL